MSSIASKMRLLTTVFASALALGLTAGCGYLVDGRGSLLGGGGAIFTKAQLNYANVKQKVFSIHCYECHEGERASRGIRLDSYARVSRQIGTIYHRVITKRDMPPVRLMNSEDLGLLRAWIEAGAPEGAQGENRIPETPTPLPTVSPTPISEPGATRDFEYVKTVLFEKHACYSCHAPGKRASDVPIDNLKDLLDPRFKAVVPGAPDQSRLVFVLETLGRNRMPPISEGAGMSVEEVAIIRDWIVRGAPAKSSP